MKKYVIVKQHVFQILNNKSSLKVSNKYPKHVWMVPKSGVDDSWIMSKTYPKHVYNMPNACLKHDQNMSGT